MTTPTDDQFLPPDFPHPTVVSAFYDPATVNLYVKFKDGACYAYANVEALAAKNLMHGPGSGMFTFRDRVRYTFTIVTPPTQAA